MQRKLRMNVSQLFEDSVKSGAGIFSLLIFYPEIAVESYVHLHPLLYSPSSEPGKKINMEIHTLSSVISRSQLLFITTLACHFPRRGSGRRSCGQARTGSSRRKRRPNYAIGDRRTLFGLELDRGAAMGVEEGDGGLSWTIINDVLTTDAGENRGNKVVES